MGRRTELQRIHGQFREAMPHLLLARVQALLARDRDSADLVKGVKIFCAAWHDLTDFVEGPTDDVPFYRVKRRDPKRIEMLLHEVFDLLDRDKERFRELASSVPIPYVNHMADIMGEKEIEARHLAARLAEELFRQGYITKDKPPFAPS